MKSRQVKHDGEEGKKKGERDLGTEGEQQFGGRKWRGLILTVGLNKQHLRISTISGRCQSINNNGSIRCQSSFGVASNIPRLIWLYSICSNNTESTTKDFTKLVRTILLPHIKFKFLNFNFNP